MKIGRKRGKCSLLNDIDIFVSMKHLDPVLETSGEKVQLFFFCLCQIRGPKKCSKPNTKSKRESCEKMKLEQFYCLPINCFLLYKTYNILDIVFYGVTNMDC